MNQLNPTNINTLCEHYLDGSATQQEMQLLRELAATGRLPQEWMPIAAIFNHNGSDSASCSPHIIDSLKAPLPDFVDAMTGEECAKLFAKLERSDPNIKEMIDRLQFATGNDRYFTMMNHLSILGIEPPYRFYRGPNKNDSQEYVFDNGEKYSSCFYR